jgi:hypothetical protein
MRYVGGNYIFDFQTASEGRGALSQNCVVVVGGQHVFLSDDDVLSWSGAGSPVSLLTTKARQLLGGLSGVTGWENSYLLYMPRQNEIWICNTQSAIFSQAVLVVDLATGHIGYRSLSRVPHGVWVRDTHTTIKTTGQMVLAYNNGAASALAPAEQAVGTQMGDVIGNSVSRDGLDFGQPDKVKLVQWVRPHLDATAGIAINVYVAVTQGPEDAVSYGTPQVFTAGTTDKVHFLKSGRFIHLKFEGVSGLSWQLPGFDVGYVLGGQE